jgi:hypothetical protein
MEIKLSWVYLYRYEEVAMKPLGLIVNPAANRGRGNLIGERIHAAFRELGIPTLNISSTTAGLAQAKAID